MCFHLFLPGTGCTNTETGLKYHRKSCSVLITSFCSIYTWYICGCSTFQHPGTVHRDNKHCDCSSETSSWEWQAPLALHLGVLRAVLPTTSPRRCSIESCSIHVALNTFHLSDCHRIPLEKNHVELASSCDLRTCAR